MFDDLKDLIDTEVVGWLEASILALPRQRLAFLTIRLKLQQGVIYAVEEDLIVNMFTLSDQDAVHFMLRARAALLISTVCLCVFLLPLLFAPLFQCQVQIEWQNHWELLIEVLATAHLRVMQLPQQVNVVLGQRLIQRAKERR